jgi:hypothetical protein
MGLIDFEGRRNDLIMGLIVFREPPTDLHGVESPTL